MNRPSLISARTKLRKHFPASFSKCIPEVSEFISFEFSCEIASLSSYPNLDLNLIWFKSKIKFYSQISGDHLRQMHLSQGVESKAVRLHQRV